MVWPFFEPRIDSVSKGKQVQFGRVNLYTLVALLQFLITPIILWKLGVAGYALVAFFATFMAFLAVLVTALMLGESAPASAQGLFGGGRDAADVAAREKAEAVCERRRLSV